MVTPETLKYRPADMQYKPKSTSIFDIKINRIDGKPLDMNALKGKFILFVNVASYCGFTNQYRDLQKLYYKYQDRLMVIGVPSNQFANQEPGDEEEIMKFCDTFYGVRFLMTEKVKVKGDGQHPLYRWLTKKRLNGRINSSVRWNFQKYLVDPEGKLVDYYYTITNPMSKKITSKLEVSNQQFPIAHSASF